MKIHSIRWHRADLRMHAPQRLDRALKQTGESIDEVIRAMLIVFIDDVEENGHVPAEFEPFSATALGAPGGIPGASPRVFSSPPSPLAATARNAIYRAGVR